MTKDRFALTGRTALVTGASSGLGAHFARVLAAAGARVVVAARRTDRLQALVEELREHGGEALAVGMDVTDGASVRAAFDQAEQAFGCVDLLINNAGISEPMPFLELEEEHWDRMLETNVKGVWRVAREGCRRMVAADQPGVVINIASILGIGVQTLNSHYATAKAAVAHLTRSMALELGRHRIRVNALAPGYFRSEMTEEFFSSDRGEAYLKRIPPRRLGELHELDGPLLLLASDAGSFLNGHVLPVDGGHLVHSL